MKKKHIIIIIISSVLLCLFIFGALLGGLGGFTRYKRIGKTNYYLAENIANIVELYHQYPEERRGFYNVLRGRITDAYWNDQYILATQYAVNSDSIEGYYIVKMLPPVEKGVPWEETKFATKEEYEQKKQELSLNEKEMKHIVFK
ncbi:MAG: hypothetical protein EZS26_001082 [Candidatus Ordinivivax streblomastigis]|uniref:DUF3139 domain-containing protein n=1 Tax=Candidatus Ordinivivax streblomastigis TaxID=2540710 RepID=A0A5M8P279_9BACT|nr:MAG: hypothetical protein EZS26_001082 [Candidatus Ordinivivax streblomastigis]